jgi:hypothetical protein
MLKDKIYVGNPCIDCISLPICKSIINDKENFTFTRKSLNLMDKCSSLKEYVYGKRMIRDGGMIIDRLYATINYINGDDNE